MLPETVSGVAYGSKGRKLIAETLHQLESLGEHNQLESYPDLLWQGVNQARELVAPLKKTRGNIE